MVATLWVALLRSDRFAGAAPGFRELITVLLPPQSALFKLESAFGAEAATPWSAFAFVVAYSAILVIAALVSLRVREL
jgi:hypothetical protein